MRSTEKVVSIDQFSRFRRGRLFVMPKPRTTKDYLIQWLFFPVAVILWLLRLEKLALVSLLFGCASLFYYAEDAVDHSSYNFSKRRQA